MIIAKHHYLQQVHLIRISQYLIWLETQRYWLKSIGKCGMHVSNFPYPWQNIYSLLFVCREKLCGHLPARAEGYSWSLVFSTSQNGFSLNSLYRKLQRIESPILVVIQDTDNNVCVITPFTLHPYAGVDSEFNFHCCFFIWSFLDRYLVH